MRTTLTPHASPATVLAGLVLLICALIIAPRPAAAQLQVRIDQGMVNPLPIAIPQLAGDNQQTGGLGSQIAQVISADLESSGLFRPLDPAAFLQSPADAASAPRFADWRVLDAQALVAGSVTAMPNGQVEITFRLWDVFAGEHLVGRRFTTTPDNWRRTAHIIADTIYARLTGESGYFDTRIVYIAETGPRTRRVKRLAIMDQDGANHQFLSNGRDLVLTPRFSPSSQEITYLSYFNDRPRVYLFNIDTGQQEILGDFPGMTFAPRFSPDGNKVIMTLATEGNSDIYTMDLRTRAVRRLTNDRAIDTSPSYAPDESQIVFNSDRGGDQQLYVMGADGSGVKRISFGDGRYATPVWSPRGDWIAFTKMKSGRFFIGVMRPDGSGERILTESFLDEGPTWAPNGRVLMFFRQGRADSRGSGGGGRLYSVDLTGRNLRVVPTPTEASDPAWSPLLPGG